MVGNTWAISVIAAVTSLMWSSSPPLVTYTGVTFCQISYLVGAGTAISNLVCGAGIALMRLLFIKHPKHIQGIELKTSLLIITTCLAITFSASYMFYSNPNRNPTLDATCLGRSREMVLVLYDYVASNQEPVINQSLVKVGFVFVIAELGMYISICLYIYKHDKSMKALLPDPVIKKRNNRNALDLFGHMLSFVVDNIFLMLSSVDYGSMPDDDLKAMLCALSLSSYGIYSLCQMLISRTLRRELLNLLDTLLMIPLLTKALEFFSYLGLIKSHHVQSIRNIRSAYLSDYVI